MLTLADIVGEAETVKHTIRGKEVTLRALTAAETSRLRATWPEPVPPPGPDPSKGSKAPWVPDRFNPAYVRERDGWLGKVIVIELAFALGYQTQGGLVPTGDKLREWGEAAYKELTEALTDAELTGAIKAHQLIGSADVGKN
jgi:hypothetical protein